MAATRRSLLPPPQRKVRDGEDTVANTRGRVRSPEFFLFALRDANHCRDAAVDVGVGGGPAGDADSHGGLTLPDGYAAPAGAVFLKFFDDAVRFPA